MIVFFILVIMISAKVVIIIYFRLFLGNFIVHQALVIVLHLLDAEITSLDDKCSLIILLSILPKENQPHMTIKDGKMRQPMQAKTKYINGQAFFKSLPVKLYIRPKNMARTKAMTAM